MVINFGNSNSSHGTRKKGLQFRNKIEASILNGEFVTFDFEGVDIVSHSFADECFAKLLLSFSLAKIKEHTTFINTNELVMKSISFTVKERLTELVK